MKKIMITSLLVLPTLLVPAEANDFLIFLFDVILFPAVAILAPLNTVTALFGIPPLTLQGIVFIFVPANTRNQILDAVCTPVSELIGDIANCTCFPLNGGEVELSIAVDCLGEDFCIDDDTCGNFSLETSLSVGLADAAEALLGDGNIGTDIIPVICVEIGEEGEAGNEVICAEVTVSATVNVNDPSSFTYELVEGSAEAKTRLFSADGAEIEESCDAIAPCGSAFSIEVDCSNVDGSNQNSAICIPDDAIST